MFRKQFNELVPGHTSNRTQIKSGCFIIGAVFQGLWWVFWAIRASKSRPWLFHTAKYALVQALIVSKCRKEIVNSLFRSLLAQSLLLQLIL